MVNFDKQQEELVALLREIHRDVGYICVVTTATVFILIGLIIWSLASWWPL